MRTTLKYFATLACIAGATLATASCASDGPPTAPVHKDTQLAQQKLQDLHDKYDWIGTYHTDGLAYIYAQLTKGNGKPKTRADVCKIAAKATKEFHKMTRHGDVPAGLVDPALVGEVCPADMSSTSKTIVVGPSGVAGPKRELSAGAMNLINQIVAISGSSTSRYAYVTGIQNIEAQAVYLPSGEAGAVIAVGSVALSSLDYWEANLSSWVSIPAARPAAYSLTPLDMTAATLGSIAAPTGGPRYGPWWSTPYNRGFGKVLAADAMAALRTMYMAWEFGPIAWDAAAASALFASATTALALIF